MDSPRRQTDRTVKLPRTGSYISGLKTRPQLCDLGKVTEFLSLPIWKMELLIIVPTSQQGLNGDSMYEMLRAEPGI